MPFAQALAGTVAVGDVTPSMNWNGANDLVVGNAAFGSLLIESPATIVRSANGWLGATPNGEGTVTVSGPGASWVVNGRLVVGANGSGTLTIANQGMVSVGANGLGSVELASNRDAVGVINIGSAPGSAAADAVGILDAAEVRFGAGSGTLNFNSTGALAFAPALNGGQGGQHQLNHYAGITALQGDSSRFDGDTTVTGGSLQIANKLGTAQGRIDAGAAPGASARVNVNNAGSTWALTGNLFVGGSGLGDLSIFYQGTVSNQFATVDAQRNGAATVTVSDLGALWNNRAALLVGSEGGRGAVSVLAGGYVASVDGVVGRNQNGNGNFLVSGHGSTWANAGELRVGDVSGQGTLSIESGGTVSNRDSYVGSMSGNGNVVVRGAGSTWNNSGAMILGFGVGTGAGALTIGQGGAVNVGASGTGIVSLALDRFLIFPTSGTLNIGAAPGQPAAGAGTLNAGAVQFGAGIATLNFNHTDTAYRFATRLQSTGSGAHSLNQVAGTTFLTGANGAFLGKTTVSGGKLVVLGQLGGSAEVTGGTLQYGDGASGAASRLAGDLKVSGAGSTLAVQGPATLGTTGDIGMADHTVLDLAAGANGAPLRADTVTLGNDVTFRLGGIHSASPDEVVLIDTSTAINGDFATVSVGGFTGSVDYLTVNTRKSADNRQYLASYDLSWTAGNNLAHGMFTLVDASENFDVGISLSDQIANATTGWDGKTLTKAGAGTLILSGNNSYTGTTTIDAGTLAVNGSIASSNVLVNSGGTLGGSGTVGAVSVASGGTLAPGNSIGTLTVNGNLNFASGSTYRVETDAAGNSDKVIVNGTATLAGNVAAVTANGNYAADTTYTILQANALAGQFDGVSSSLAFLDPSLSQDANHVYLTLARNDVAYTDVASTRNQRSVAAALQNVSAPSAEMSTVINAVNNLSADQARAAYDSIGGAGLTGMQRSGVGFSNNFSNQLMSRLQTVGMSRTAQSINGMQLAASDRINDLMPALAQNTVSDASPSAFSLGGGMPVDAGRRGFWLRGFGSDQDTSGDGNAAGSRVQGVGISAGFDARVRDNLVVGVAFSHSDADVRASFAETGETRSSAVAVYASHANGPWTVNGNLMLAHNANEMDRNITVGTLVRTAHARFDSKTVSAYGEVGYDLPQASWTLQPLAGLAVLHNRNDGFTETGAGALNIRADAQSVTSTRTLLGARALLDFDGISVQPRAIWAHEFGDVNKGMTAQFQGAPAASFTTYGVDLPRDSLIAGITVAGRAGNGLSLFADVQGEFNSRQTGLALLVGLRKNW
ncbi:autotransporter domain-containing protein [Oxalicibacterium flavum]|uniref:autotransporter domain-containing protein n=1 Tax=Oxalicibacterium flavum TaxID=179467 RepID=UPI001E48869F|nr:autotransporter domain-containing protein [Oxalicibacterium flavum]